MLLSERIEVVLRLDPEANAVELDGEWTTWGDLAAIADAVRDLVTSAKVEAPPAVGVLMTNRPAIVGATLGVLLGDACVVTLNPHQGDEGLTRDVLDLRPPIVIGTPGEWDRSTVRAAVEAIGALGIVVETGERRGARTVSGLERLTITDARKAEPGVAVEMLTSGTTGPPKRVPLPYSAFERTLEAAQHHYRTGTVAERSPALSSGTAIIASPFVHMSGVFRMLLNVCEGRRIALLERFRVPDWVTLVERHRPRAVSLVPTALRMVYDADVDPAVLASVRVVTCGSAALDPQLQERFEQRYGTAVLTSYGATEFAGGVAGWTLPLHQEWIDRKRGSVGRPQPGRMLRIVDPSTGEEVDRGAQGVLEVGGRDGGWVRTTDLARIDDDEFVWIDGRTDDAILRGGFKVFPDEIVEVLRRHPAVHDVGVTGVPDERLGAVPVAAVELHPGAVAGDDELLAHAAAHLVGYKVPARLVVVDSLPRTPSMKVSAPGVRALFE